MPAPSRASLVLPLAGILASVLAAGCTERSVPTAPGAVVGVWTRAEATAPGIASGKPAGTPIEKTWKLTTPQGVVLEMASTTGELDFEAHGRQEHAKVPLAVEITLKANDGWTVSVKAQPGPLPLLNGPFDDKVLQLSISMRRWRRAWFGGEDVTETAWLELHGDGALVAGADGTGRKTKIE